MCVLQYIRAHILDGAHPAAAFADGLQLRAVNTHALQVARSGDRITFTAGGTGGTSATVTERDLRACGAVLHIIGHSLVPGDDALKHHPGQPLDPSGGWGGRWPSKEAPERHDEM